VSGIRVGALFEQQKVFDVVVWGAPETRNTIDAVQNLMLDKENGSQVRLADVAEVRLTPATSIIRREGVARRMDVEAEVAGRPVAAVAREAAERIKGLSFPFEYRAQVLGEHIEARRALRSVGSYAATAAILGFLVLQAVLGSWRLAFVSLLGLPIALLGSVVAVYLTGQVVSLGSLLGCGLIIGLTVRGGILMVRHFQTLEREQGLAFGEELVQRGVRECLTPTLAPLVVTGAVVLPFVLLGDRAGLEIAHPLSVAVLGGFVTSAAVTLLAVPALYLRFGAGSTADPLHLEEAGAR
jgi:Cu/Ag efflux pump CusA